MQNKKKPTIRPRTIKSAVIKQRISLNHPSGKKQTIIIKTMITLTIGTDNKQSIEIRSFIKKLYTIFTH